MLSLSLAIFTFVGSVGVGVFTHFCHDDGIEQSFVIPQANGCEDQHEEIETCCAQETEVVETAESDCCSDEIDFFQVEFDQYENSDEFNFTPVEFVEVQPFTFTVEIASSQIAFPNYANPPPIKTGRQILIEHQVFRI